MIELPDQVIVEVELRQLVEGLELLEPHHAVVEGDRGEHEEEPGQHREEREHRVGHG